MKPSQLIRFRIERKWNKTKMAKQVGISRDTLSRYEMQPENKSIPLSLAFTCAAIAWHLKPFGEKYNG